MAVIRNGIDFNDLPKKIKRRLKPEFRKPDRIRAMKKEKENTFNAREAWLDIKKRIEENEQPLL